MQYGMASIAPWLYFNGAPSLQIAVIERHASRLCNAAKHRALAVPHWSTDPPNDRDRAACIKPMDHPSIAPWLYCTGALSLRITAIERRISYSITCLRPSIAPWLYFNGAPSLQIAVVERQTSRLCNAAKHRALAVLHWGTEPPNLTADYRDRPAHIRDSSKTMQCSQASRFGFTSLLNGPPSLQITSIEGQA